MKLTKSSSILPLFVLATLILAACSGTPAVQPAAAAPDSAAAPAEGQISQANNNASAAGVVSPAGWVEQQPQIDQQGAVAIEITPVKLNNPGSGLDFDVRMNTHSVDLSMNLAELATLSTDTGKTVQATKWDAPASGHHVSGRLSFPSSVDGAPLLDGVKKLTLTLKNVDVPERVFVWEK